MSVPSRLDRTHGFYSVSVSTTDFKLVWPTSCVCCGAAASTSLKHSRNYTLSDGLGTMITETFSTEASYCGTCQQHVLLFHRGAGIGSGISVFFGVTFALVGLGMNAAPRSLQSDLAFLVLGLVCLAVAEFGRRSFEKGCSCVSANCCSMGTCVELAEIGRIVTLKTHVGYQALFTFRNRGYAERFAIANQGQTRILKNPGIDGTG